MCAAVAAVELQNQFGESVRDASELRRTRRGVHQHEHAQPRRDAVEYMFLLRDGDQVTSIHDRHVEGLFSGGDWHAVLAAAGFDVKTIARDIPDAQTDRIFLCRRP